MSQKRELRQTNRKFGQLYSEEAVFLNKDRSGPRARGPGRPHASVERRPHPLGHQEGPGHREDRPLPRRLGGQQQLQSRQRHVALLVEKKDCREREKIRGYRAECTSHENPKSQVTRRSPWRLDPLHWHSRSAIHSVFFIRDTLKF